MLREHGQGGTVADISWERGVCRLTFNLRKFNKGGKSQGEIQEQCALRDKNIKHLLRQVDTNLGRDILKDMLWTMPLSSRSSVRWLSGFYRSASSVLDEWANRWG
jgi:hypothetical protein